MFKLSEADRRAIGLLLTPSWLSAVAAIAAGLIVSVGVVVAFEFNTSGLQQQLIAWQQNQPQAVLTQPGETLPENDRPTLQGSWPLLLLWSLVGLGVYLIVAALMHQFSRAAELRESLGYVNARPDSTLATTGEHLLLRAIASAVLVVFAAFFLKQLIPYCITASHASAADFWTVDGLLYVFLSFALIALGLHILTILGRLALGRARVFPGN